MTSKLHHRHIPGLALWSSSHRAIYLRWVLNPLQAVFSRISLAYHVYYTYVVVFMLMLQDKSAQNYDESIIKQAAGKNYN